MSLDLLQRRRYARQILLSEIGKAGQERLCAHPIGELRGDRAATDVAERYLLRAGLGKGGDQSLGLPEEGLIHVSELADHYVADPGEIVTVGQEIVTRVIQVDPVRKRVSLSLKDVDGDHEVLSPPPAPVEGGAPAEGSPGASPAAGGALRAGVPQSRSQALAELNRLFKDK